MFDRTDLTQIQTGAGINLAPVNLWQSLFITILPYIFSIAGIILLFNLVSAGIKLMTSRGEPKNIESAKAKITTSLIGILILFSSFWIVKLILQFIGINVLVIG